MISLLLMSWFVIGCAVRARRFVRTYNPRAAGERERLERLARTSARSRAVQVPALERYLPQVIDQPIPMIFEAEEEAE